MKLRERVARVGARRRLSPLTVDCYGRWIDAFLRFARQADGTWRTPAELSIGEAAAVIDAVPTTRQRGRVHD